jgi:hypothetical protein
VRVRTPGQIGHSRAAAVRADDQARTQPSGLAVALAHLHAADLVSLADQRVRGVAQDQLDAEGLSRLAADQRVEQLAAQVDAARHDALSSWFDPAPASPQARVGAQSPSFFDRFQETEPLERGRRGGLDEVAADALERRSVRPLLHERH